MEKIKLSQAVIVEGKYDKIRLASLLDAFILETNGFSLFKDTERMAFIKKLAAERGIVILTDSDHAGFMIRNRIAASVPKEQIVNVYIPDVYGKEKRKAAPSAEGKLGVEGMSRETLLEAFERAHIGTSLTVKENPVTTYDLLAAGLTGVSGAKARRKRLLQRLELPEFLSVSSLISCINYTMTKEEFYQITESL